MGMYGRLVLLGIPLSPRYGVRPLTSPELASAPPTAPAFTPPVRSNAGNTKLKFNGRQDFLRELRRRVDEHFATSGKPRRDVPAMFLKSAIIMAWFWGAYFALMFLATTWWSVLPLAVLMGLAVAAVGFNLQHDGGHKAYSSRPWLNKFMALTMDMCGASSFFWDTKHNSIHHTYTNVDGHDDDIDLGILGRLSPAQPRYKFHRLQHLYLWFLYGFITIKWNLWDDFQVYYQREIGHRPIKRPRGWDFVAFWGMKIFFLSFVFLVPMLLHPWWAVIGVYLIASFVNGVVISVVFQLAHCVEEADFPEPKFISQDQAIIENEWAIHQVETTVDFARSSFMARWFLGGLNFQVEHHLFSHICHINYPQLSKIVEETCADCGIKYNAHPSFWSAVKSHYKHLLDLGRPVSVRDVAKAN